MIKNDKIKVAFLDRDGVINKNAPPHEYVTSVKDFVFNPGIFSLLRSLIVKDYNIIVVTNQRGVARGKLTEATLYEIHSYMAKELATHDAALLDVFYCPHEKDTCNCRKPKPGLVEQAKKKYNIDFQHSIFISDNSAEAELATLTGIGKFFLVPMDHPEAIIGLI